MMAPPQRPQHSARPKSKTPAERAEEHTALQRRLKAEAAERRAAAAAKQPEPKPAREAGRRG